MLKEACDLVVGSPDGIYIDGTLGGGGHTSEILSRLSPKGKLFSFDKDEEAIDHCRKKFASELSCGAASRLVLVNDCFSNACSIEEARGSTQGILLDLGVSSRQLDNSRRGFSYRANSRLDMKFGSRGTSAEDILFTAAEEELESILRLYGEEPFAKRIARRLVESRRASSLTTTFELRDIISECVPQHILQKSLSRVFQALRIAVNGELDALELFIKNSAKLMASGGNIVIISYHSLEDRIVKNFFKEQSLPESYQKEHKNKYKIDNSLDINKANTVPYLQIITKKPITPSFDEINLNPRSRSAKMRAAKYVSSKL